MPLPPGTRLGAYEIISQLGAGGMGEVYRARDSRLERDVAIKVLPQHLARNPELLARFEREVKAVAALSHPNILAIHDFGSHEGLLYAVTELLEGESLRSRIDTGPLAWRKAAEIAITVAEGLSTAHAKGIIHRDLKPENIFLTSDGRVKILDFGLARWKPADPKVSTAVTITDPGTIMGTVSYMAPEQIRGIAAEAPSDIFALGCVLYEMVTARKAFGGPSSADAMAAILSHNPPQASDTSRLVPPEIDRVISHCLEKNAEERFQSASDLAFALKATLTSSSASTSSRVGTAPRRRRKAIESLAVLPFINESHDPEAEYLGDGIAESLINSLSQVPKLRVMARSTVFRLKAQAEDPLRVGRELDVRAVLAGRVLQRGDTLVIRTELVDVADGSRLWGEQYHRKVADLLQIEEEISREIAAKLQIKLSGKQQKKLTRRPTESTEAYQLYLKGRYWWAKRTIGGIRKGIEFFQQAIAEDPGYALAYSGLADCYELLGWLGAQPPRDLLPKAKAAAQKALELDPALGEAHASLASVLAIYEWNWAEAEKEFHRAVELNPAYSTAYQWYAVDYLASMGRSQDSIVAMHKALDLEPLSLSGNSSLALALFLARRYSDAVEQCRKTLELFPKYYMAYWFLGLTHQATGNYPEAMVNFDKAVELSRGSPVMLAARAHAQALTGKTGEARQVLEGLHTPQPGIYVSPLDVAIVHLGLGEIDQAFEWIEKAFQERTGRLIWLKVHPLYDPLRSDPRMDGLLQRLGLVS